jgi:hypothetical protein
MELKKVFLSGSGRSPQVAITFGFAQHGRYRIYLWSQAGDSPRLIGQGVNTDDVPDRFDLGDPLAELNNRIVSWEGLVTSFDGGTGEQYSVQVDVGQDGANCLDGPFIKAGSLDDVKAFYDAVRLVVR